MKGGCNKLKEKFTFLVVGGDKRQIFLAKQLFLDGHRVYSFATERYTFEDDIKQLSINEFSKADIIIFPTPTESEKGVLNAPLCNTCYKTSVILDAISPKTIVFAGGISKEINNQAKRNDILLYDYINRDDFAIGNAISTCEGALQIAINEMPITLHGANVLVIGNGRIGSMLSCYLKSLCANVTVSARSNKDFALIKSHAMEYVNTNLLIGKLSKFDLIINTVPACVLGACELSEVNDNCVIIDLASKAGGVDFESAERLGKHAIHALSLPGKVAPISAANVIKDTIYTILQEEI